MDVGNSASNITASNCCTAITFNAVVKHRCTTTYPMWQVEKTTVHTPCTVGNGVNFACCMSELPQNEPPQNANPKWRRATNFRPDIFTHILVQKCV